MLFLFFGACRADIPERDYRDTLKPLYPPVFRWQIPTIREATISGMTNGQERFEDHSHGSPRHACTAVGLSLKAVQGHFGGPHSAVNSGEF
jgi:hypothetical protein